MQAFVYKSQRKADTYVYLAVRDDFELGLLRGFIAQQKPVLGICLGAQLLAHVLGAPVQRNETPEIGWYPLWKTVDGFADPVLAPLQAETPVFQWHGCTYDLPSGAMQLARTTTCEQR